MKNKLSIILITGFLLLITNCYAAGISSDELIQNAKEYDGKEVMFQGEVIGDIMKRGNFYWVNISDGKNALGIFVDGDSNMSTLSGAVHAQLDSMREHANSMVNDIAFTGDYSNIGDTVEVTGMFHRACLEHGGDLDIHASLMRKVEDGHANIHKAGQKKVRIALWLTGILFILVIVEVFCKINRNKVESRK